MVLVHEINKLRADSLSALDAGHNFYGHTRDVWRLVQEMIRQGHKVTIRNQTTGDTIDEQKLPALAQEYITGYLAPATFQHFISLFEDFVFDFLRAWLTEFPGSLFRKQVDFRTILNSADKAEIVQAVIQQELGELRYKRVDQWFTYCEKIVKLGCPNPEQIARLSEMKASRDVLVHNKGTRGLLIRRTLTSP